MENSPSSSSEPYLAPEDFEYQPLPGLEWIRVLTVLPSTSFEAPIECVIETVALDGAANYQALSYSWGMNADGDATPNRTLLIRGKTKHITQNLFEGLLRLRQDGQILSQRLWVDAVCINQADDNERTKQVARMREIFENAWRTFVWLGEGDTAEDDAVVSSVIRCMRSHASPGKGVKSHTWRSRYGQEHPTCPLFDPGSDLEVLESSFREIVGTWLQFFTRRWFSRRWGKSLRATRTCLDMSMARMLGMMKCRLSAEVVYQELVASNTSTIWVLWGCYRILLCNLIAAMQDVKKRFAEVDSRDLGRLRHTKWWYSIGHKFRYYGDLYNMLRQAENDNPHEKPIDLLVRLQSCSHMQCSDPRDILYSLLGLTSEIDIVPDYNISTVQAYTNFARWLLERGDLTCVLGNAASDVVDSRYPKIGLPSWVPDLRRHFYFHLPCHFYRDSIPLSLEQTFAISKDNILTLRPYVVGIITTTSFDPMFLNESDEPGYRLQEISLKASPPANLNSTTIDATLTSHEHKPAGFARPGDTFCSTTNDFTAWKTIFIVFRALNNNAQLYRLVAAFERWNVIFNQVVPKLEEQVTIRVV